RAAATPRRRETVHSARLPPPAPAGCGPGGPLTDHDFNLAPFAGAQDVEADFLADRIATQHIEQLLEILESFAVDRRDDIAKQQSGLRRGSVLLDRHEQQAVTLIVMDRLHGGADPAARNISALEEL